MVTDKEISVLTRFIALFDLHISGSEEDARYHLKNDGEVEIYDKNDNLVGYARKIYSSNLFLNVLLENSVISSEFYCNSKNNKSVISYNVQNVDNGKEIDGNFAVSPDYCDSSVLIYVDASASVNKEFIGTIILSTQNNEFYVYDYESNSKIKYKEGKYSRITTGEYIKTYQDGNMIYYLGRDSYNKPSLFGGYNKDCVYNDVSETDRLSYIIPEVDQSCKKVVSRIKSVIDEVAPTLFKNMVSLALDCENDNTASFLLGVNDSELVARGKLLRKKRTGSIY